MFEMFALPSSGQRWAIRLTCDGCGRSSARRSAILAWDGDAPITDTATGMRRIEPTLLCSTRCWDRWIEEERPGKIRHLGFRDFLIDLARDILPAVMPDAASEIRLRLELVLSAYPDQWLPAKRVHEKLPGQVRTSGAWQSALSDLVADGKVEVRRTRTNPSARFRTEYLWRGEEERRN